MVQVLAVVVTIWLVSHSVFIFDTGYRTSLRALWEAKHGPANYTSVLTPRKMVEVASGKKRDFLEGHNKARGTTRPWAAVEEVLENALVGMFERTDPMKAWELKKLGSTAWQSVGKLLRRFGRGDEPSPAVSEQTKVLIYNRIPKSGSSLLLELLYTLGGRLGVDDVDNLVHPQVGGLATWWCGGSTTATATSQGTTEQVLNILII